MRQLMASTKGWINMTAPLIKTWRDVAHIIKLAIDLGVDPKGKTIAKEQLDKMADAADTSLKELAEIHDLLIDAKPAIWSNNHARKCAVDEAIEKRCAKIRALLGKDKKDEQE